MILWCRNPPFVTLSLQSEYAFPTCSYIFRSLSLSFWFVMLTLSLSFMILVFKLCRFFHVNLESIFKLLLCFDRCWELFFDFVMYVWACGNWCQDGSCKQTVSNNTTGTYRYRIRVHQQHSVKTPSNPYPGRSQSDTPEGAVTDIHKYIDVGWVAGVQPTTVDLLEPPPTLSVTRRELPMWPAVRVVWCWPWQDFRSIIEHYLSKSSHKRSRQIAMICEGLDN